MIKIQKTHFLIVRLIYVLILIMKISFLFGGGGGGLKSGLF